MKSYLLIAMMSLILGACTPVQWTRANTSEAQLQSDNRNCQSKAMSTNQVVKLQANSPESSGNNMVVQSEWQSCMRALGYSAKRK